MSLRPLLPLCLLLPICTSCLAAEEALISSLNAGPHGEALELPSSHFTQAQFSLPPNYGKPVFLYNLLDLKRATWEGPELAPGKPVTIRITHWDGATTEIQATHTMSDEHIAWFKAGSALNMIRQELGGE